MEVDCIHEFATPLGPNKPSLETFGHHEIPNCSSAGFQCFMKGHNNAPKDGVLQHLVGESSPQDTRQLHSIPCRNGCMTKIKNNFHNHPLSLKRDNLDVKVFLCSKESSQLPKLAELYSIQICFRSGQFNCTNADDLVSHSVVINSVCTIV